VEGNAAAELYLQARGVLERKLPFKEAVSFQQEQHQELVRSVIRTMSEQLPRDEVERHITSIHNEAYIKIFSLEDIAGHLAGIRSLETISSIIHHEESHSAVTAITHDAPFLFPVCAVFSRQTMRIFSTLRFLPAMTVL